MNSLESSVGWEAIFEQIAPDLEMVGGMRLRWEAEIIVSENPAVARRVLLILKTGRVHFEPPAPGYLFEI